MATRTTSFDDLPPIMTLEEARLALGLGKAALYRALGRGEIPGVFTIGAKTLVLRDVLLLGLRERAVRTRGEVKESAAPAGLPDYADADSTSAVTVRPVAGVGRV